MKYQCISADCHIDLTWLPYDLFTKNASAAMKERMPYVEQTADGPKWMTRSGFVFGYTNGPGITGAVGSTGQLKYVPGDDERLDRMAATGLFEDAHKGVFRPTTPELRLKDQDRDGIQAEILYGLLGAGVKMPDREAAVEVLRIYNEWLADFCRHDSKRFVGLASLPTFDVETAVSAARHAAKLGLGGLDFAVSFDMIPLWDPYWEPFWKTAADVNMAVHFHTIGMPPERPMRPGVPEEFKHCMWTARLAGFQMQIGTVLASIIGGGALERYPSLRIVLGESGIGWIPYVLQRLDEDQQTRHKSHSLLKMSPSDYWHRQCRATFQNDEIGIKVLDVIGVENVMWGSDYPHRDGVFPDSQEYIARQFKDLPEATRRKITCENAGKFYGLMS